MSNMQPGQLPPIPGWTRTTIGIGTNLQIRVATTGRITLQANHRDVNGSTVRPNYDSIDELFNIINRHWSHPQKVQFRDQYTDTITITHVSSHFTKWNEVRDNAHWITALNLYLTHLRLGITIAIHNGLLRRLPPNRSANINANRPHQPSRAERIQSLKQQHRRQLDDLKTEHQNELKA